MPLPLPPGHSSVFSARLLFLVLTSYLLVPQVPSKVGSCSEPHLVIRGWSFLPYVGQHSMVLPPQRDALSSLGHQLPPEVPALHLASP